MLCLGYRGCLSHRTRYKTKPGPSCLTSSECSPRYACERFCFNVFRVNMALELYFSSHLFFIVCVRRVKISADLQLIWGTMRKKNSRAYLIGFARIMLVFSWRISNNLISFCSNVIDGGWIRLSVICYIRKFRWSNFVIPCGVCY